MQNFDVQTLGVSEDVKMTRIYLVAQMNFFGTKVDSDDNMDENPSEDIDS